MCWCQFANAIRPFYACVGAEVLVLTFREVKVSQEVRLLSTGCARGLQLDNSDSQRINPHGFEWDFLHSVCRHKPAYKCLHLA